ncbi:MAG TPA: hypothetical protein V6D05_09515 [Stenomitos sp.]
MPSKNSMSALALMLILAGCAAQAHAPTSPDQPAPAVNAPDVPAPQAPQDPMPDTLVPAPHIQDNHMPYAGDLDHPVVIIQDGRFQPYYTHVRLGGSVTWVNRERSTQTVSSPIPGGSTQEGFWEGSMQPGQSYTKTFSRFVGTFTFYTKENPDLHGNIIVVGKPNAR